MPSALDVPEPIATLPRCRGCAVPVAKWAPECPVCELVDPSPQRHRAMRVLTGALLLVAAVAGLLTVF